MDSRVVWIKRVSAILMLAFLVMAFKVWTPRLFPLAPVFYALPPLPDWLNYVFYALLFASMIATLFLKNTRLILVGFTGLLLFLMLYDYNRIQPYYLQLLFVFWGLALNQTSDPKEADNAIKGIRLYFCFMYFFSGFFKFNVAFIESVHPWFVQPFTSPLGITDIPSFTGYIIAIVEVVTGIGLFFKQTRNVAVVLAILTHGFILACLGPFGHSWNYITWPWNIGMAILTFLLFWNQGALAWGTWEPNRISAYKVAVLVVAGILPWLFLTGKWDSFLSFDLYSGKTKQAIIYLNTEELEKLPFEIRPYVKHHPQNPEWKYIDLTFWGLGEMNTLPYPENRAFHKMHRSFSENFFGKESVGNLSVFSSYSIIQEKELKDQKKLP
ncbi:MAG: hypothetical protein K1X82_09265 [Bacteroidia bacterium]|nr:hypothetical protein [Bacteroidia bacterium]